MTRSRDLANLADGTEFSAADHSKLDGIEASATADQTSAQIKAAVEAATDSNVFTDADHSKLNGVAAGATDNTVASAALPKAGGAVTGNVTFGDGNKAIFGAGSDLQIYSDGTTSRIYESGSGLLTIRASNFNVNTADGSESYITMQDGGAVTSYFDGAAKIATSASGISVTGAVTSDALAVSAATNNYASVTATNSNTRAGWLSSGKKSDGTEIKTWIRSEGDGGIGVVFTETNHNLGFATNNAAPQMTLDTSGHLITKGGVSIDSATEAGPELSRERGQNLKLKGQSGTDAGITAYNAAGNHAFQIYGNPSETGGSGDGAYGFLDGNWAGWDIKKYKNGNLFLNNSSTHGLAGDGVLLGSSAAGNKLSYYEEGNWSPTLPNGGTTNSTHRAEYTRIGRMVYASYYGSLTPTNNSNGFHIGGLPFVSPSNAYGTGSIGYSPQVNTSNWGLLVSNGSSPYVYFYTLDNNTAVSNSVMGGNTNTFIFWITYRVNA